MAILAYEPRKVKLINAGYKVQMIIGYNIGLSRLK